MNLETNKIHQGDALSILRTLPDESVNCIVTSPPYYGLRDYGAAGQMGLEDTPQEYVARMTEVFQEARRVLRADGTLWLNMGDSYANDGKWGGESCGKQSYLDEGSRKRAGREKRITGLKPKSLLGMPWRLAFALQADGWYLRQDIIWSKPNPMPESVKDRCTKSHEYIFLLSKSLRYYYDQEAILEPVSPNTHARISQDLANQIGSFRAAGGSKTNGPMKAVSRKTSWGEVDIVKNNESFDRACCMPVERRIRMPKVSGWDTGTGSHSTLDHNQGARGRKTKGEMQPFPEHMSRSGVDIPATLGRNKRSVWTIAPRPYRGAHFAVFPEALVEPCILAGCPEGGVVMDPFIGSGTVARVAIKNNRRYVGIELNPDYIRIAERELAAVEVRLRGGGGMNSNRFQCCFCGKEFLTKKGARGHESRCIKNPSSAAHLAWERQHQIELEKWEKWKEMCK